MKRLIMAVLAMCLLVGLPSCNDDGILDLVFITGVDQRECACCGGFMINFTGNPEPYADEFMLAYELPANSGITFESVFPIYAWINWETMSSPCDVIEVTWLSELQTVW